MENVREKKTLCVIQMSHLIVLGLTVWSFFSVDEIGVPGIQGPVV